MKKTIKVIVMLTLLAVVTMGAKDCKKQDVITGMEIAGNTLDVLYNGTAKVLIAEYCKGLPEEHENANICQEWKDVIDPATAEFLGTTYPSVIRIAEVVIPNDQQPLSEEASPEITRAYVDLFRKLSKQQQADIYAQLVLKQ